MVLSSVLRPFGYHVDFLTDRLCRIYTIILFFILAISLSIDFQKPGVIKCLTPSQFNQPQHGYSEEACKHTGTFYPVFDSVIPKSVHQPETEYNMSKMKYLPVVLCGQALLFLLPWILWNVISAACCSLPSLVKDAAMMTSSNIPNLEVTIANEISKLKSTGRSITLGLSYLVTKGLYWIICLVQMAILSHFLNINFYKYRYNQESYEPYIYTPYNETDIVQPFPRMLMCDFQMRTLGNVRRYTVQCLIPINESIERYLYVVWAWLIVLLVLLSFSGIFNFFKSIFWLIGINSYKRSFIKHKIVDENTLNSLPSNTLEKFGKLHLKPGVFLALAIIEENASLHATSLAVNHMWEEFLKSSKINIDRPSGSTQRDGNEQHGCIGDRMPLVAMESAPEQAGLGGGGPYQGVQEKLKEMN